MLSPCNLSAYFISFESDMLSFKGAFLFSEKKKQRIYSAHLVKFTFKLHLRNYDQSVSHIFNDNCNIKNVEKVDSGEK